MKKMALMLAFVFLFAGIAKAAEVFTLSSSEVKNSGELTEDQVFNGLGCTGNNISPSLTWSNPPAGTQSFAVTMYDPDAPTGSGWWHWVVYNIPASVSSLVLGAGNDPAKLPEGAMQSLTDFGVPGFGGACPPAGDRPHQYVFTVYALSSMLDLPPTTMPAAVGFNIYMKLLGKTSLTATYAR